MYDPERIGYGKPGPGSEPRAGEVATPLAIRVTSAERARLVEASQIAGSPTLSTWMREVLFAAAEAQQLLSGAPAPEPSKPRQ